MENSYHNEIGNMERRVMTIHESKLTNKQETDEKNHIITKSTVTLSPHHISMVPLTLTNYSSKKHTDTLLEMEENTFFAIEQPNITTIHALQKLDNSKIDLINS